MLDGFFILCGPGGNRTRTVVYDQQILSLPRLPITPLALSFVPSPMRRLQTMTIWAKYSQIFKPVISVYSINMIKLERYSTIHRHFCPTTQIAFFCKNLFSQQSFLQFMTLKTAVSDQNFLKRDYGFEIFLYALTPPFSSKV